MVNSILHCIENQFNHNKFANLLYKEANNNTQILSPSLETIQILKYHKDDIASLLHNELALNSITKYMVNRVIEFLISNNQFFVFNNNQKEYLINLYKNYLYQIKFLCSLSSINTLDIEKLFYNHSQELQLFLINSQGINIENEYSFSRNLKKVVCEEYSTELQVELLGINLNALKEPVLDIGCGVNANLVNYLRGQGVAAYGLDRSAKESSYISRIDWLATPFKKNKWGTIISHMAFSNHFHYHQSRDSKYFKLFIVKLNEILESLMINGKFIYTPLIEDVENYIINKANYETINFAIPILNTNDRFFTTVIVKRY